MKLILIFISILLNTNESLAYDLKANPIYHSIKILNKRIPKKVAYNYSNIIAKFSKKYKIDPFLVVSISRQESHINLSTTRELRDNSIIFDEKENRFIKIVEVTDFCMMQIHKGNVINKNLDVEKLLSDPEYCIHEGIKILSYFKYLKETDKDWWTRYNALDPEKREVYKSKVMHHYSKIIAKIPNYQKIKSKYTGVYSDRKVAVNTNENI